MSERTIVFGQSDGPAAPKLNMLNQVLRRMISALNKAIAAIHGHSSVMPDTDGRNNDHDIRYYTKAQINALLAGKADIDHTHE